MGVTRQRVTLWVVASLLVAGAVAGAVAGSGAGSGGGAFATGAQIDADSVVLGATLGGDDSAIWEIEHRIALDDENATQAFETLQADIRRNRSAFESRFRERMRPTVWAAENATGREMVIRNVTVSTTTTLAGDGLVRYAFEWVGFAVVDGDRVRAGDAIAGLYLDTDQTLQFEWPDRYGVVSISPQADDLRRGVAVWGGREAFASDEPSIVLSSEATPTNGGGDSVGPPGSTATSPEGTPAGRSGLSPLLLVGLLAALLVVAAGVWLFVSGDRDGLSGVSPTGGDGGGDADASTEDVAGGSAAGEPEDATPPEELLSNEERVLRLLEEHGGRMKQQDVVSELDWTDAKTSQVVGTLREEDRIEVFRIGRENVLALPGESDL